MDEHTPLSVPLPYYQGQKKISLNTAFIRYQTLPQDKDAIQTSIPLPYTPEDALKDWANQCLKPDGSDGTLNIIIRKKEFKEEKVVPTGTFLTKWMETEKVRLNSHIEIALEFYDADNNRIGVINDEASHSRGYEYTLRPADLTNAWRKEMVQLLEYVNQDVTPLLKPYTIVEN